MSAGSISRRTAALGALTALLGATALAGAEAAPASDGPLVEMCHRFAEEEFELWYRYIVFPEPLTQEDRPPDWDTFNAIVATPATSPVGWQAKALAYAAWDRGLLDRDDPDPEPSILMLGSFIRDMAGKERDAIIERLRLKYGPLPDDYTPNGIFLGRAGS